MEEVLLSLPTSAFTPPSPRPSKPSAASIALLTPHISPTSPIDTLWTLDAPMALRTDPNWTSMNPSLQSLRPHWQSLDGSSCRETQHRTKSLNCYPQPSFNSLLPSKLSQHSTLVISRVPSPNSGRCGVKTSRVDPESQTQKVGGPICDGTGLSPSPNVPERSVSNSFHSDPLQRLQALSNSQSEG